MGNRWRRWWVLALLLGLLAPLPVWAQAQPLEVKFEPDLVFGKGGEEDLKLDMARPAKNLEKLPAVVCLHGGGWRAGNRQQMRQTIEFMAGRGFVAVAVEYRLSPRAQFPAQIEDCKAAVRWLRTNQEKYGIHGDKIGAMGTSAGGHLACLLGTTGGVAALEGKGGNADQSSRVQAVVSFFGPTDFSTKTWTDELEKEVLAPFLGASFADQPERYRQASPLQHASKEAPPFLLFHGTEDKLVAIRHSKLLAEKLQKLGVSANLVEMEGEGHGWKGPKLRETLIQTMEFLDEKLKK